jgi:hypothetical protein
LLATVSPATSGTSDMPGVGGGQANAEFAGSAETGGFDADRASPSGAALAQHGSRVGSARGARECLAVYQRKPHLECIGHRLRVRRAATMGRKCVSDEFRRALSERRLPAEVGLPLLPSARSVAVITGAAGEVLDRAELVVERVKHVVM